MKCLEIGEYESEDRSRVAKGTLVRSAGKWNGMYLSVGNLEEEILAIVGLIGTTIRAILNGD